MKRFGAHVVYRIPLAGAPARNMEVHVKLKMLGLLGALAFAAPIAAVAAPASGITAETSAPAALAPAVETNAAVTPGTTAKVEKIWWRGGWGWHRGWGYRGFGWRGYGWRGGYGWRRPWGYGWRRRYWW